MPIDRFLCPPFEEASNINRIRATTLKSFHNEKDMSTFDALLQIVNKAQFPVVVVEGIQKG